VTSRILIAGVGNIFFGDDAFGCEVINRMRGTHLAFELMSGYDGAILLDAVPKGGEPGTLYVIEPDIENAAGVADAHSMDLGTVFAFMRTLEGKIPRTLIIGCEPQSAGEGMGLSEVVDQAVSRAIPLAHEVLEKYFSGAAAHSGESL